MTTTPLHVLTPTLTSPESPAGAIHIKFTLTDQFNNKERNHTHHTAFRSGYLSKTDIHHFINTLLHLILLLYLIDNILKDRKNCKDKKGDLEVLINECPC